MGRFVMLSENLLNLRTFPNHSLAANEFATGREVEFVQSGRRQKALNHWTPTTENSEATITLTMDRPRGMDMIVLDRGHNLANKTIRLRVSSQSSFGTYTELGPWTLPDVPRPYARLSEAPGVRTPEGAWLLRFPVHVGKYVRFVFDAMGSGLKPEVVGLYCGLAFRPEHALVKPFSHGMRELDYQITKSPYAWAGAGTVSSRRVATPNFRLANRAEYAQARYHVEELFLRAKPSWIVMDDEEAEKAFLARAEPQTAGFEIRGNDWSEYQGSFVAPEHEPKPI